MIRISITILIISFFSVTATAQKSKVLAIFQLIETGKYEEAKTAVEEAIEEESTGGWYRTWYARGLLSQKAYEEGIEKNDKKKYELYPDQLYVAFDSYEKAMKLDKSGKITGQLAPKYVLLANDLLKLAQEHYGKKEYQQSLRAFEHVLKINQSPLLTLQPDTNLLYNTALAAYNSGANEKASDYLGQLNESTYSSNVPHLLASLHLGEGDTTAAVNVLTESMNRYTNNVDLVLMLADLHYQQQQTDMAVRVLDTAAHKNDSAYIFPYTKGLVYQKAEQYEKAIKAYKRAVKLAPGESRIYINTGTCYYNIGVDIERNALKLKTKQAVQREKKKSLAALESATEWYEKAYESEPENQEVISMLNQLYKTLQRNDKLRDLEQKTR